MAKKTSSTVLLRRTAQTISLLLFLYLFLLTAYHPDNVTIGPIKFFFNLDPLIMLSVRLGGHAVATGLLLSLITLIITLVFGRWFCGWICPFGAVHNLFTAMRGGKVKEKTEIEAYSVWQKAKYYILVILLVGALFGVNIAGLLDPFSFFYRSMTTAVFPAVNIGFQVFFEWIYRVNPINLSVVTEPLYRVLRQYFLLLGEPHYLWSMLLGILFGIIILLNFLRARFWCRYICPLGGLLGLFGKNPTVRVKVDPEKCTDCMVCVSVCPTGADPQSDGSWRSAECIYCWNCESICPTDAISFQFRVPGKESSKNNIVRWIVNFFNPKEDVGMDLERRRVLAAGIAGLGGGLLFQTQPLVGGRSFKPDLIRPPGAISEDEFLEKCLRCGECMKVCPTNVIQPAMLEGGLEGLWSPVIKTWLSYCEYKCNMCTQVCPTEAILKMRLEEKQKVKIGLAHIDKDRCLPYAYERPCFVCEQICPLPIKAIWLEEATVRRANGKKLTVEQPHVDAELCIGCGLCENKCPVSDEAAIRVTSVGETRNFKNQFLTADRYSG